MHTSDILINQWPFAKILCVLLGGKSGIDFIVMVFDRVRFFITRVRSWWQITLHFSSLLRISALRLPTVYMLVVIFHQCLFPSLIKRSRNSNTPTFRLNVKITTCGMKPPVNSATTITYFFTLGQYFLHIHVLDCGETSLLSETLLTWP